MSQVTTDTLTIDELARRSGMTVRNIRAHQSRGLLQPPEVRGRTGYYNEDHLARIELIRDMQGEGLNLEAIRRLLEDVGGSSAEVLGFTRTLRAPFEEEEPLYIDGEELTARWTRGGSPPRPETLERAIRLGFVRPLDDDRYELVSPLLGDAAAELAELGIDADRALDVLEKIQRHARGVARTFVELFLDEVWEPFERAGRPEHDWPKVREALERLRPLASESLLAVFNLAMSEATEKAALETLAGQSSRT
ncbi:MAG TPA: MerR family transcriptional regulator [Solirubrobacterales bacterium]|nr:MerR family transcriptional regulator [Solirubrobacterales bacterium]